MKQFAIMLLKGNRKDNRNHCWMLSFLYACPLMILIFCENMASEDQRQLTLIGRLYHEGKLLALMSILVIIIISYLMVIAIQKKRYTIGVMRGIGVTYVQVMEFVFVQCAILLGLAIGVGTVIGCAGGGLIQVIAHFLLEQELHFRLNWKYIGILYLMITVSYVIEAILLHLILAQEQLQASFKESTVLAKAQPLRIKSAKKVSARLLIQRNRKYYRITNLVKLMSSVMIVAISAICIHQYFEQNERFSFYDKLAVCTYHAFSDELKDGISEDKIQEIRSMPHVKEVMYDKYVNVSGYEEKIQVIWPGWSDSEYIKQYRRFAQADDWLQAYDKEGDYFEQVEIRPLEEEEILRITENKINLEKYHSGEECILYMPPYQVKDMGYREIQYETMFVTEKETDPSKKVYHYDSEENQIKAGDTVEVRTPWGTKEIVVAAVVYEKKLTDTQMLLVSEKFLEDLCGVDGNVYNSIRIDYEENMDYEKMDQMIYKYFAENAENMNVNNSRKVYGEIAEQFRTQMFQYIVGISVIWLLGFIILYQGHMAYKNHQVRRFRILHSLGMTKRNIKVLELAWMCIWL